MKNAGKVYEMTNNNGFQVDGATVERETEKAVLLFGWFSDNQVSVKGYTFWVPKSLITELRVYENKESGETVITTEVPFWFKPQLNKVRA